MRDWIMNIIRKLTKVSGGTSYAVTLPKDIIRKWRWQDRQNVVIEIDERSRRFIVSDWKPKK